MPDISRTFSVSANPRSSFSLKNAIFSRCSPKCFAVKSTARFAAAIATFNVGALSSESVCDILDREYSIAARGGLHCAPLVHKHFSTIKSGAVRLSLGFDNTESEIDETLRAVREIAKRENNIR